jgi:5-methylcytosine-specific restriction endonuclease McrA
MAATPTEATATSRHSRHLPNDVRRAVLERDGLRCAWQGPDGTRCNSRAWLEYDHVIPRGQGGTDDPENIRPFCRSHNRLAAEQAYGRVTINRIIANRQADGNASSVVVVEA